MPLNPQETRYGHYRAIAGGSRTRPPKNKKGCFREKTAHPLFLSRVNSQGLVHSVAVAEEWIGAKRRPLTRGAAKPLVWFCQWVRFVSTQAVGEGLNHRFCKKGKIYLSAESMPESMRG